MRVSTYGGHRRAHGDASACSNSSSTKATATPGRTPTSSLSAKGLPDNLYRALLDRLADWPLELPDSDGQPVLIAWGIPIEQTTWPSPRHPGLPELIGDPTESAQARRAHPNTACGPAPRPKPRPGS